MLQRREFSHTISWTILREMGIDLERTHSGIRINIEDDQAINNLKENMPEMLRITGYDVNMQPNLSLDYFWEYITAVFDVANHPPKPSGRYLFNEQGYRVLVDDQGTPVKPGGVRERGIDFRGKKFVKSTYCL